MIVILILILFYFLLPEPEITGGHVYNENILIKFTKFEDYLLSLKTILQSNPEQGNLIKDKIEYLENYLIKYEKNIELEKKIFHKYRTKCNDTKTELILNKFKKYLETKELV